MTPETHEQLLERVMRPHAGGDLPPPAWGHVLGALMAVMQRLPEPVALELCQRVLDFDGEFALDESFEMPHSLSPENMARAMVAQGLVCQAGEDGLRRVRERLEKGDGGASVKCRLRHALTLAEAQQPPG